MDLPPIVDIAPTQFPAYVELHRDVVLNADIWTAKPQILAANWGFEGIMGIPGVSSAADLGRALAVGAGVNGDFAKLTPTPPLRNLTSGGSPIGLMAGGFGAAVTFADAFPIEFSWPMLPSTVSPTDFAVRLNTGEVVTPKAAALNPNYDYNERHVVVMLGEFGNRLLPGTPGAVYPVSVEIVKDDTPLQLVGPNGRLQSAVGMTKAGVNPYVFGPGLVGARLIRSTSAGDFAPPSFSGNSPNDGASLYKSQAAYRLRLYTWGGFSPDGVSPIMPTEYARYFKLQAVDAQGRTVDIVKDGVTYDLGPGIGSVKVVGLAELGKVADGTSVVYQTAYYQEDHDNYVDIILAGDEAAIRRLTSVAIPTSAEAGYSDLYTPGGPGRTPSAAYTYTAPAKPQTFAIDIALDDPAMASYAAQRVASYDSADGLPVVFRLRHPTQYDTVYTASSKQAASLIAQGYVEQGVPFSNEQNAQNLASVRQFYSESAKDHVYTADAAEIERLRQSDSGYVDQGVVFTAVGEKINGTAPIYRFYSAGLGEHFYTPSLTEGFTVAGYAYEGVAWYSVALTPGLSSDVLYDRADDVTFGDALTGNGALAKRGAGTLTLTGANTLSGATTVEAGTLRVDGSLSQSAVTVAAGGTLSGTGSVGALTVRGVVSPGGAGSVGTLTGAAGATFMTGSTFAVDIAPAASDRLAAASAATVGGGVLRVTALEGTYAAGTSYDILTARGGVAGAFSSIALQNPERLGGLAVNVANTGSALTLSLANGATPTSGADIIAFYGGTLSAGLSGLGSNDTLAFLGTGNRAQGDIGGAATLQVGAADGAAAALVLRSGTQSFGAAGVQSNATLTVNSRLEAAALVNAGTLGGGGAIVGGVLNAGVIAPGNSPGVLTVSGAVENLSSASFQVEIDGPTAGSGEGYHDQLAVVGAPGTFIAGGTIAPTLRGFAEADASPYTPALGRKFAAVTATGGISGSFSSLIQPAAGLPAGTRFDVAYATNAVYLAVTPTSYAALGDLSANQRAAAAAFDSARPAAGVLRGGDIDTLYNAFYLLEPAAAGAAFDQLSGVLHAETLGATLETARLFGDALGARAAAVRRGGLSVTAAPLASFAVSGGAAAAGPAETAAAAAGGGGFIPGVNLWGRAFGRYGETDGDGESAGRETATGGFVFGMDGAAAPGFNLGVGFGYFAADVSTKANLGKADIDSYAVGAYAAYQSGGAFVDGSLSYTYSDYDSRRPIRFGAVDRTAAGSGQGHAFGAAASAGYQLRVGGAVIEPAASLRYDYVGRKSFSETGAGDLGLRLGDESLQALRSGLGVRAATLVNVGEMALEPEVRLRWDHDFLDRAADSQGSLAGRAFTVSSAEVGRDALVLGAGLTARLGAQLDGFVSYDAALRDGGQSHTATAGLRYRFP